MKQLVLDIAQPPTPTLDNFVPGRNSELVIELHALANGGSRERFLYLWGDHGSGRSHLLRAVVQAARHNGQTATCFDAGASVSDPAQDALFAVDDVHLCDVKAQIALFNLHNRIHEGHGTLIVSGNAAPAQLALRADLVTRLASGLVYQVHGLNDGEKSAALRRHADARGFRLSHEVSDYLLRHARRDMPSLLALLDALDRHSLETKRAVSVPLLRKLLEDNSKTG